jgi:hypothetical protein
MAGDDRTFLLDLDLCAIGDPASTSATSPLI